MPPDSNPEVPGWSDEELRATALRNYGVGSDAGLPDELRFRIGVTRALRHRMAENRDGLLSEPSVFVLCPNGPAGVPEASVETIPMLDNGRSPVEGRMWFVGAPVARGRGIGITGKSDIEIFAHAHDDLGIGDAPAVFFEPRVQTPQARFFPHGLGCPDACDTLLLSAEAIDIHDVLDVIERIYRSGLVTPDAQSQVGKLWANAKKYWPSSKAEELIQLYLRMGLAGAFPSCIVRPEQDQATGRLDLEIEEQDPDDRSNLVRHAILELKVLRSFYASGTPVSETVTKKWIKDGVTQAAAYRSERGARASALCCFDMRKDGPQNCFAHVSTLATRVNVVLYARYLFATAKAYREHVVGV